MVMMPSSMVAKTISLASTSRRRWLVLSSSLVGEALAVGGRGLDELASARQGAGDAGFVKGLEQVVEGVDLEGLDSILVVGGGEYDMRELEALVHQLLEDAEAVKPGHLHIEEDQVGGLFLDQVDGFEAVASLADDV